jgi:outer membrane protein assembly factor BamD
MFFNRLKIVILLGVILLAGCGKHQKLMKSTDNEAKYAAAMDYYQEKDYYRALQLFQQLVNFYQGTEKAEKLQFYYAYCYYYQEDNVLASYYFKRFVNNYPRSPLAEEAMYMNAYCYFLDSPVSSLDQENTYTAIKELQLFINLYPNSARVSEATDLIDQLRAKLQRKDLDIAKLYLKMKQYEAAIYSYKNVLKDYPDTEYKEEILYSILRSNFYFAQNSIPSKQAERYQSALDSYNELVFEFPDTKYMKDAKAMNRTIMTKIGDGTSTSSNANVDSNKN